METKGRSRWVRLSNDAGAAITEFAVSASVFLMALIGIIQCCLALYSYSYVSDAARVATRYAIVRGGQCSVLSDCGIDQAGLQTYLRGISYPGINPNNLTVTAHWYTPDAAPATTWTVCPGQCNAPGNAVQVQVTYTFPLHIPYWKNASISMKSASRMIIAD